MIAPSLHRRPPLLAAALLLAAVAHASPNAPAQTWTIDAGGGGDFVGIAEAIASASVASGDQLLVGSGTYAGFALDKSLAILASAGATVDVGPVTVGPVTEFTLAGLRLASLEVDGVDGRGRIEECTVGTLQFDFSSGGVYWQGWTHIRDCGQVSISRSLLRGTEPCYPDGPDLAESGLTVERSTVAVVDCTLIGGDEAGDGCSAHYPTAGAGLRVLDQSDVTVAGSDLSGGVGWFSESALFVESSTVRLRGSSQHALESFVTTPAVGGDPQTATVSVSGVTAGGAGLPGWVIVPPLPLPYLSSGDAPAPGGTLELEAYAVAGAALFAFAQADAGQLLPPIALGEFLWLNPVASFLIQPFAALGQDTPVTASLQVPNDPLLTGLALTFQGWAPPQFGAGQVVTNPVELTLRW